METIESARYDEQHCCVQLFMHHDREEKRDVVSC